VGETPNEITHEIEQTRAELGYHLRELETRVKGMTDWREQFRRSPFLLVTLAFGGGILLGATGGRSKNRY